MKKKHTNNLLKVGILFFIIASFIIPGTAIKNNKDHFSENLISVEQARELIEEEEAVLLNIQSDGVYDSDVGGMPVTLGDLACGSCIGNRISDYSYIIVYSQDDIAGQEAIEILEGQGYAVFKVNGLSGIDPYLAWDWTICNPLKPAGPCSFTEAHTCIGGCTWVCDCSVTPCQWTNPYACKSGLCAGQFCA